MIQPSDRFVRIILPLGFAAILLTVGTVGWVTQPDRFSKGYAPEQPIPYSHKLHAGTLQIPCLYCHTGAPTSRHAGIPPVEKCMNCHKVTKTDSPAIKKLAAIYKAKEPILWKRVHNLPDHVFFDHRLHVNGGIECQTCHGEIREMEVVTTRMSLRMSNCLGCHRKPPAGVLPPDSKIVRGPQHCDVCHR